jgi:transketolase
MTDFAQFEAQNYAGRNLYYGIREHAMVAALNGMVLHGGIKPYGGTFLVFSDYCKPSIRIAALSHIAPVMVFTHDSIGLGEDGPTHQPIEHLAALRAIPNSIVLRPADANEVAYAWKVAIETKNSPVSLILTRQNIPTFARNEDNPASLVEKGAYILSKESGESPDVILIGTGSEVHLCMDAQAQLKEQNIDARVVSMPSWELFEKQDKEYKESVFPKDVTARISVEAGSTMGWQKWIGDNGIAIGIDHFGGSAPYQELMNEFGFTVENVVESAKKLV